MYDWTSHYRKQLLNRAIRCNKNSIVPSSAIEQTVRYEVKRSLSSSYHETDQLNIHNENDMHCEQEGNHHEICFINDNSITLNCSVVLNVPAISNKLSYDKYLQVHDLCEICNLCVCFLNCGECFHDENCQLCAKCIEKNADNDYDESNNIDKEFNISCESISFKDQLAEWALDTKINHHQLRSLLTILNSEFSNKKLPKNPRILMKTSLKSIVLRNVPPGQYWHNGFAKQLRVLYNNTNVKELKLT